MGSTNERENRLLWCARLFTIISYFRAIFKSEWVPVILCIGVLIFAPMYRWNEWKSYSRKRKLFSASSLVL